MADNEVHKSSPVLIAAAWLLVLIPAGWGLTYTVQNAKKLFTAAPAPTPSTTPASSAAPASVTPPAK